MKSLRAGLLLLQVIAASSAVSTFITTAVPSLSRLWSLFWVLGVTVFMAVDYPLLEELEKK